MEGPVMQILLQHTNKTVSLTYLLKVHILNEVEIMQRAPICKRNKGGVNLLTDYASIHISREMLGAETKLPQHVIIFHTGLLPF